MRRATQPTAFVAVLLAAAIDWFAPMFGISLFAFLVVEGLLG